tara:strand:- start:1084 stop:2349 length:1266 start_codon:yes stop_codon:yes gene_type:complete
MKWIGQHIVDIIARFRSDVYLESVAESTQDHVVGIDANGKLYKQDVSVGDITAVTITTDSGGGSAASDTAGSADFSILGATGVGVTNSGTTITATAVPAEIDHDSLQNFVTAEHVDWAGSSAGTIHSSNIPTLNQNTTGSAATLTTPRAINGVNFDGSGPITVPAAGSTLTDTVTVANGGTGLTTVGANQILTGNATGALTSEANLTFGVDRLHIGADDEITPQIRMQNDENTVTVGIADSADNLITGSADGDFVINSTGDHNVLFGQNNAVAVKIDTDGDFNFNRRFTVTGGTDGEYEGDVVYFGGTTSMTVGKIYHYKSDGTWEEADADAVATSDGLLAVALGAASDTNGMLLRGMVTLNHDPGSVGDVLFLSTVSGQATSTAPSANNDIVRVIGYQVAHASDGKIWFNPDGTFVEVTA